MTDQRAVAEAALENEASAEFLGRWSRLVSTTNWEKGRIISEWRAALEESQATAAERSDETWSRLVGNLTPQHAGRLRRTYDRFGSVTENYTGLYWSHFQAALDWNDAEMWLEGALLNSWSVAKMRETRAEAHGNNPEDEPELSAESLDEDSGDAPAPTEPLLAETAVVQDVGGEDLPSGDESADSEGVQAAGKSPAQTAAARETDLAEDAHAAPAAQPLADLPTLPDDLADAFDAFKVAIVRHRLDGWQEVTVDETLAALSALRELALAPSE